MKFDPLRHHRRSTRLPGFDYSSPGAYFVTVCVQGGVEALGTLMVDGEIGRRFCGEIAASHWEALPLKYPHVILDEFVVMPDHFHAILHFADLTAHPAPRVPLGTVMGFWKFETTRAITLHRCEHWGREAVQTWQRGFYERIIRDERELEMIRHYIGCNPQRTLDHRP